MTEPFFLDRRLETTAEIRKYGSALISALTSENLIAYAVDFHGNAMTALGYQSTDDTVVPLCLLLDQAEWVNIAQMDLDWTVVKNVAEGELS
jgi:hypothetical protein